MMVKRSKPRASKVKQAKQRKAVATSPIVQRQLKDEIDVPPVQWTPLA